MGETLLIARYVTELSVTITFGACKPRTVFSLYLKLG